MPDQRHHVRRGSDRTRRVSGDGPDQVTNQEIITLVTGVLLVVLVNASLLRARLVPLDRLARQLDPAASVTPAIRGG